MSCRGPWEVQAPQHIPEALPFHFLGGHCPGHVTQDSSPLAVIPETLPQLLSLLTAAWGLRQIRENVYEALQKPETWAQAHLPPTPCTPLTKPRADSWFQDHSPPSTEPLFQGWSAWPPCFTWVHVPQQTLLSLSLVLRAQSRWAAEVVSAHSFLLPSFPRAPRGLPLAS